ncbi:unnamed protein product [Rotaria magnacalcarata]
MITSFDSWLEGNRSMNNMEKCKKNKRIIINICNARRRRRCFTMSFVVLQIIIQIFQINLRVTIKADRY